MTRAALGTPLRTEPPSVQARPASGGSVEERVLSHHGFSVGVVAPAADLRWLAAFLDPAFATAPPAAADVRVTFERGYDASLRPEAGAERRSAFALDAGPLRLPARVADGELLLLEDPPDVLYRVRADGRETRVAYARDRLAARVRLMRVVREHAHAAALQAGGVVLHASAVVVGGRAVAIAGPKGSGKTTAALLWLAAGADALLANDRVLARPGASPRAAGVPTIATIRRGTLRLLPGVAAALARCGDFRALGTPRGTAGRPRSDGVTGALRVGPGQLAAATGRPLVAEAPLGAVLVLDGFGPGAIPRRLGADEATWTLARCLLGRAAGVYRSAVFVGSRLTAIGEAALEERCRALVEGIPCFSGRAPHASSLHDARRWFERLLPAAR